MPRCKSSGRWRGGPRHDGIGAAFRGGMAAGAGDSVSGPSAGAIHYGCIDHLDRASKSRLFGHLLPAFTKKSGIQVRVIAVGTGQALKIGEHGDADVVFVHDRPAELAFVERGYGVDRHEVMYNDFILVGPSHDPAHGGGGKDIVAALQKIAEAKAAFVSRGDDS